MRPLQHPEGVILHLLHEANAGLSIGEICSTAGISPRTFYRWRKRYGGLTLPAVLEMKDLHLENVRLRALVAHLSERLKERRAEPAARLGGAAPTRDASLGRYASVRGQR